MQLQPIGRVEDPQTLDLEPIVVPVVGYDKDHAEHIEEFRFRPIQPTGASLKVLREQDEQGNVPVKTVLTFLDKCLMAEDHDRWEAFLDDPHVFVGQDTIVALYEAVMQVYAERPTVRQSASRSGAAISKRTSGGAARGRPSTGKGSRSR